jgi:hypothetical protein
MPELLPRQDAADRLGVHFAKLERLRTKGLIPEAVKIGRYFVFPAAQLEAIRRRLVEQGHIKERLAEGAANGR